LRHRDRRPARGVEAGRAPPRLLEARVVGLARIDLGDQDRTGGDIPVAVAYDDDALTARERDVELREQTDGVAVVVPRAAERAFSAVPAAAQHGADDVLPLLQEWRDVVRLVLEPLVVTGPARGEQLVADALAVQMKLVEASAGDVGSRTHDVAGQHELAAQIRRGRRRLVVFW